MLRLYDTATRQVRELALREPGKVGIYLCGPTVYGPPHIGHGRATLEYDVLVRYLRWSGLEVQFVSNVTDVDDKIINRANDEGRRWEDIAAKCESVWWQAMDGIGNVRPDDVPHATTYIAEIVEMIGRLVEIGGHTRRTTVCTSPWRRSRTTACSPTNRSTTCSPGAASARSTAPS